MAEDPDALTRVLGVVYRTIARQLSEPALEAALRVPARRHHPSIANLPEVLIRRHCEEHGISLPEQQDLWLENVGE